MGGYREGLYDEYDSECFLKVDVDQSDKLAQRFGVEGVPTLIFFRQGQVVDKLVGSPAKDALKRQLDSLL